LFTCQSNHSQVSSLNTPLQYRILVGCSDSISPYTASNVTVYFLVISGYSESISSGNKSLDSAFASKTLKASPGYISFSVQLIIQYLNCSSLGAYVGAANATASALSTYIIESFSVLISQLLSRYEYTTFIPSAQSILLLHFA
jgi:hypothetical protein